MRVGAVPLDPELAAKILRHRGRSAYNQPTDFVFAGESAKPRWQETTLADLIKTVEIEESIPKPQGAAVSEKTCHAGRCIEGSVTVPRLISESATAISPPMESSL
jgi:hypothetical protein